MAFEKSNIVQLIGGLIYLLVYSAHAAQDSESEGIFGSVYRCKNNGKKKNLKTNLWIGVVESQITY